MCVLYENQDAEVVRVEKNQSSLSIIGIHYMSAYIILFLTLLFLLWLSVFNSYFHLHNWRLEFFWCLKKLDLNVKNVPLLSISVMVIVHMLPKLLSLWGMPGSCLWIHLISEGFIVLLRQCTTGRAGSGTRGL